MQFWGAGFILAICAVALSPQLLPVKIVWVLFLLGSALLLCRGATVRVLSGACIAIALASSHGTELNRSRIDERCEQVPLQIEGTVASLPQRQRLSRGDTRLRFVFEVDAVTAPSCAGISRLLLSWYGEPPLAAGERWRFVAKLRRARGRANPTGFGVQAWYARTGVDAIGHVVNAADARRLPDSTAHGANHHRLRQQISQAIAGAALSAEASALLQALTVADSSNLDDAMWRAFRHLGISHLLVISGLHIGLVATAVFGVVRLTASGLSLGTGHAWLEALAIVGAAGLYSLLAGLSLPTQRAWIMLCCIVLLRASGRQSSTGSALLLAACLVLALNPLAVIGSGFWLSFGAVLALIWFSGWLRARAVPTLLLTHLYMTLVMVPLGAWFFGGSSLLAMPANLFFIPVVGCYVVPLALLGAVLSVLGLPGAGTVWSFAAWPLDQWLLPLAALASGTTMPGYLVLSASAPQLLLALAALPILALPGWGQRKLLAVLLMLPLLAPADRRASPDNDFLVTVLDVGQGTAIVLQGAGRTLVYDAGPGNPQGRNAGEQVVLPFLRAKGVRRLDTLIVSHGDNDHSGGAATLLSQLPVARLRYGAGVAANPAGRRCRSGESWRWGANLRFRMLSPGAEVTDGRNNGSCVLLVEAGGYRLLLAGDIETVGERALVARWRDELRADWLLVPHHGSATSSTHTLLKSVRARQGIVSAGFANAFGHPSPKVVARLREHKVEVLATATLGAMQFEVDSGQLSHFVAWRQRPLPYWM